MQKYLHLAYTAFVGAVNSEKIGQIRRRLGLSQEEAGRKAGIGGRQSWGKIETGKRVNLQVETIEKIAAVLGLAVKDLIK